MPVAKTVVVCALVAAATAGTAAADTRDVSALSNGKGTKQTATRASGKPNLLGAVPTTGAPAQSVSGGEPSRPREVSALSNGKGTKRTGTSASGRPALLNVGRPTDVPEEPSSLPSRPRDVSALSNGKGTKQTATRASGKPNLLGAVPTTDAPATSPPLSSFFTACRAAVRQCLVVAPRSVLSCVFSMPPSDGAMTSDCSAWIARREQAIETVSLDV